MGKNGNVALFFGLSGAVGWLNFINGSTITCWSMFVSSVWVFNNPVNLWSL
jgi:hypothetical protein